LRFLAVALIVVLGCRADTGWDRVLTQSGLDVDTTFTELAVEPPFVVGTGISALCLDLDSTTHVVELPHIVLRRRTSADTTHMVLAMERRTTGFITVTGRFHGHLAKGPELNPTSYASSHALCFGNLPDTVTRVGLRSSERLRVKRVAFRTSTK